MTLESMEGAPDIDQDILTEGMFYVGIGLGKVSLAIQEHELDAWIDDLD